MTQKILSGLLVAKNCRTVTLCRIAPHSRCNSTTPNIRQRKQGRLWNAAQSNPLYTPIIKRVLYNLHNLQYRQNSLKVATEYLIPCLYVTLIDFELSVTPKYTF